MCDGIRPAPQVPELFMASLIATALVYTAGSAIIIALSLVTSGDTGWQGVMEAVVFFAFFGAMLATAAAFLLVAPLGTAFGLAMLRVSPPGWWQGPLTGLLVAFALETIALALFGTDAIRWTVANIVTMSLPVVLSLFAGAYVQQRVLRWPSKT